MCASSSLGALVDLMRTALNKRHFVWEEYKVVPFVECNIVIYGFLPSHRQFIDNLY